MYLCGTQEFHWHLTKYNALDLLKRMQDKNDEKISEMSREVCEKVIDHIDENLLIDQDIEIQGILKEPISK